MNDDREQLRRTFTTQAERYDRARPRYPEVIFDDIVTIAGVGSGDRALEIGCGTGQATRSLASRGLRVVAVELGAEMAAVARDRMRELPGVRVVNDAFEDWPLPDEPFDLVLSATSFGWVDPDVRCRKSSDALREGGWLVALDAFHVAGGTTEFFHRVQECYERHMPGTPPGLRPSAPGDVPDAYADELRDAGFDPVETRRYLWTVEYTTKTYLDVIQTYSGHIALDDERRRRLLECIARILDTEFGGRVTKQYLTRLAAGRV